MRMVILEVEVEVEVEVEMHLFVAECGPLMEGRFLPGVYYHLS